VEGYNNAYMSRRHTGFFVASFFLLGIPAYAYGDPTGGSLFQILLPMLAAVWAMFLIFANRIRRAIASFVAKLRGSKADELVPGETRDETLPS
jgi:hypothetical protein